MKCCECGGTIPKGTSIYKNFSKGYSLIWEFPLCKPCYLKTMLEPKYGKEFVMKYCPRWYEKSYPPTLPNGNEKSWKGG